MAKPKYDYKSPEFLETLEKYAKQGFTDKEIAFSIGLCTSEFSEKKSAISEIAEALARGRSTVNAAVRQTYLSASLGKIKTKQVQNKLDPDGNIIYSLETETEQPPNLDGLRNWLFNHDEEWRRLTIEGKKLDITTNGKDVNIPVPIPVVVLSPAEYEKKIAESKDEK